jgi:TIR domain
MTRIFINFRNADGDWAAKLIKESLTRRFGEKSVFLSSDSIPLAARFPDVLAESARTCDVMLALVGPRWLDGRGPDGHSPLFADGDWVRREIATALAAGRPAAAVRLNGARRLVADDLPPDIRELADRQDITVDRRSYDTDIARLEEQLMEIAPGLTPRPRAGSVTAKSDVEIEEGEDITVVGAEMPAADRPVDVEHRLRMKKGKRVTSKAIQIAERDPKAGQA